MFARRFPQFNNGLGHDSMPTSLSSTLSRLQFSGGSGSGQRGIRRERPRLNANVSDICLTLGDIIEELGIPIRVPSARIMRQVLGLLVVVWFVLCHPSGGQSSCPNRIRKPWGVMTQAERNLYVEALGIGMQKGYHILFTEVASEKTSSTEFLRTCGFLYWNRRFVLAYENMLRSLGPKYACLTIPYWDYFADYARFVAKKCENNGTSIEACSPILRGLGGSQGTTRSVTINGRTFAGNCVTKAPANSFCESSTITTSSQCSRCIPRGNWAEKTFPASFGYAGLGVALGEAGGFRDVTQNIQTGTHST